MKRNHRQQNKVTHDEFKKRFMPLQQILYREAYRMLCDRFEAEDAVQNLYMKLWEKKDELKHLVAPEAYCRTLLKNICIDRWRQMRARDGEEQIQPDEITAYTPPDTESKEAEECLQHFLAGLPQVQQKIIQMKMNGCTFEEIEEATGLQQTNIRVIISRVRKRFREFYDKI
jgi:RNA polymerase sigma-70 factor (ECF subfamily)